MPPWGQDEGLPCTSKHLIRTGPKKARNAFVLESVRHRETPAGTRARSARRLGQPPRSVKRGAYFEAHVLTD